MPEEPAPPAPEPVNPEVPEPRSQLDPNVVGGVGLAMGGVIGLGLGLKAEHDAEAQGKPVSWVTQAAIIRGALGLGIFVIALIVFLIVVANHHQPASFFNTCNGIPRPGPKWSCQGGYWIKPALP